MSEGSESGSSPALSVSSPDCPSSSDSPLGTKSSTSSVLMRLEPSSSSRNGTRERPTTCLVCGDPAMCIHYSVPTCMACKAFFRRTIVRRGYRRFKCRSGPCADEALKACPACRFSRCLTLGMDARTMRFRSQQELQEVDGELKAMRRALVKRFDGSCVMDPSSGISVEDWSSERIISDLLRLEGKLVTLRESAHTFNPELKSLRETLARRCELGREHQCEKPDAWPLTMQYLMALPRRRHWFLNDIVLSAEMAKALPGYMQMDVHDQMAHIKDVLLTVSLLTEAFYSYKSGAETLVMPDGFTPVIHRIEQMERVGENPGRLVSDAYVRPVMSLQEVAIDKEEYVLLKALMYLRAGAITQLSGRSEAILSQEYEKYASVLLKHLQLKFGAAAGARKYAELLGVLNAFLHFASKHVEFHTYIHVVHRYPEMRHLRFLQGKL